MPWYKRWFYILVSLWTEKIILPQTIEEKTLEENLTHSLLNSKWTVERYNASLLWLFKGNVMMLVEHRRGDRYIIVSISVDNKKLVGVIDINNPDLRDALSVAIKNNLDQSQNKLKKEFVKELLS